MDTTTPTPVRRPRPTWPTRTSRGPDSELHHRRRRTATRPTASALNPRGFWATMNTEGAENVQRRRLPAVLRHGHEHPGAGLHGRDRLTTACYDADNYYNYAVEMPAGSTGGERLRLRPGLLRRRRSTRAPATAGSAARTRSARSTSSTTPRTRSTTSPTTPRSPRPGRLFQQISASDTTMGGSGGSECKYSSERDRTATAATTTTAGTGSTPG